MNHDVPPPRELTPAQRRRCTLQLRLIWGAMAVGLVVLAAVLLNVLGRGSGPAASTPRWLSWLPMGLLLGGLPVSYFIRNQCYKRTWRGHRVDPAGYVAGNLFVFAMLEIVVVAGLVVGAIVPTAGPARAAAVAAFVLLLLNFPSGRPLDPQPPGLGARSERSVGGGR